MRKNQVMEMREQESGYPKELPLSLNLGPGPLAAVGETWGGGVPCGQGPLYFYCRPDTCMRLPILLNGDNGIYLQGFL